MKRPLFILSLALAAGLAGLAGYRMGAAPQSDTAPAPAPGEARILYYRHPMGLPDTSPVPKKDEMGMDYIPVRAGDGAAATGTPGAVQISAQKVQQLGVRTEPVARQALARSLQGSGRIEADERRMHLVAPRFEGYIERLHVNASGQFVQQGQTLLEAYSPELLAAQREYLLAREGAQTLAGTTAGANTDTHAQAGLRELAQAGLARLRNWGMGEAQLQALAQTGTVQRSLALRAPVAGFVTDKKVLQGQRFMPGEALFQISDLSSVWVLADLSESDMAQVKAGQAVTVRPDAYPGLALKARVEQLLPSLNSATRSATARITLANPGLKLRPGMFVQVQFALDALPATLTVPLSAVLDKGRQRIVLVQQQPGRFVPREVTLGERDDSRVQVLQGLQEGETVVVAANFLIDAESNLQAALAGLGPAPNGQADAQANSPASAGVRSVGHQASGTLVSLQNGEITLQHGPVPSLQWPAMTMDFKLSHGALAQGLKAGAAVDFEFVERAQGEWVITALRPRAAAGARPAASAAAATQGGHAGHDAHTGHAGHAAPQP